MDLHTFTYYFSLLFFSLSFFSFFFFLSLGEGAPKEGGEGEGSH